MRPCVLDVRQQGLRRVGSPHGRTRLLFPRAQPPGRADAASGAGQRSLGPAPVPGRCCCSWCRWPPASSSLRASTASRSPRSPRSTSASPSGPTHPRASRRGATTRSSTSAMTEQRRQEARGAVRPVYDLNPEVVDKLRVAVKRAFGAMRAPPGREGRRGRVQQVGKGRQRYARTLSRGSAAQGGSRRTADGRGAGAPAQGARGAAGRLPGAAVRPAGRGAGGGGLPGAADQRLLRGGRGGHAGAPGAGVWLGAGAAVHRRLARGAGARGPAGHHRAGRAPQRRADAAGPRRT